MGIGRYLHRKKDDSPSPPQPNRQSRVMSQGTSDAGLRTSRYEATAPGSAPETGSYPIRGNTSSVAVTGGKSAIRNSMDHRGPQSARPETAPSRPTGNTAPRLQTPPNNHYSDYHFFDHPQASPQTRTQTTTTTTVTRTHPTSRQMEADAGLSQDFSGLNINHDSRARFLHQPSLGEFAHHPLQERALRLHRFPITRPPALPDSIHGSILIHVTTPAHA